MDLTSKKCVPCEGGTPPLDQPAITSYLRALSSPWLVRDRKKIEREFKFRNFIDAVAFVNKVAQLAEGEAHHPDIHIHYNKVRIESWTHAIGGLSENDFILAAKIERL